MPLNRKRDTPPPRKLELYPHAQNEQGSRYGTLYLLDSESPVAGTRNYPNQSQSENDDVAMQDYTDDESGNLHHSVHSERDIDLDDVLATFVDHDPDSVYFEEGSENTAEEDEISYDEEDEEDEEEASAARHASRDEVPEHDIDVDGADEDVGEDDENDDEDEEEDDDEDDDEDEDDLMGSGLYRFMAGGRGGSSFLREMIERSRAEGTTRGGSTSQHPTNILDVMQRLVGDLEGPSFGRQHSEFDSLLENIIQREDTYLILESINELSEKLLMMDGMTAERVISPGELAKALVDILTDPSLADDLELHLVTCRCLYNFIEVNTDFINDALNSEAVETLVGKVMNILYIDLTEQCLQTLEIMSRDRGSHSLILASDGLKACLQNLDFFTVHSQRKCLQIVANACENISTVYFDFVLDQFQNLVAVAQHHEDSTVKKSAWLGVSRIIDSFKDKPDFLEKLFSNNELLCHMLNIIRDSCNPSSTDVGVNYHSMISLLKSLIILVSTSVKISNLLLDLGIGDYIKDSLNKFKKNEEGKQKDFVNDSISIESLISCPKDLLSLFLHVIAYLSPITYSPKDTPFLPNDYKSSQTKNRINYDRNLLYRNEKSVSFLSFMLQVWPVLLGSFQATMDYSIRKQSLICLSRMVAFSDNTDALGKRNLESLFGILTSVVSSGKILVSKACDKTSAGDRSLNSPLLLLLNACIIIQNLLTKSQLSCAHVLEREGVFSDLSEISKILEKEGFKTDETGTAEDGDQDKERRLLFANVYQEKFGDRELVDFSQRCEPRLVMRHLKVYVESILHSYQEYVQLGDNSNMEHHKLHPIVVALRKARSSGCTNSKKWLLIWHDLTNALSLGGGGISSFELSSLGLLQELSEVFKDSEHWTRKENVAIQAFVQAFYTENERLIQLVALLQESLARAESFEVISSGVSQPPGAEGGSASLAKQIKLKLVSDDETGAALFLGSEQVVVSVHAIATFKAIEKFLTQKRLFASFTRELETDTTDESEKPDQSMETEFFVDGRKIPRESTVFGVIFGSLRSKSGLKKVEGFDLWGKPHEVHFRARSGDETSTLLEGEAEDAQKPIDTHVESILSLLKALFEMNEEIGRSALYRSIPTDVFMNWKLTVKLNRQLEEPLIVASGTMPHWSIITTNKYPFVFPLSTRMFFLQSTSFGHSRLIHNWNNRAKEKAGAHTDPTTTSSGNSLLLGAPARKKVRLSRDKIFKGAIKVLQQFGLLPPILEIEYFDEVGSGLGPTLEFYSSVSKAFCKKELTMWRHSDTANEYADSAVGIFPAPINTMENNQREKSVLFLFKMLGVFIARALLDSRIIDFNFNIVFISLVQNPAFLSKSIIENSDVAISLDLLEKIDPELSKSMRHLARYLEPRSSLRHNKNKVDGLDIAELSLYFCVPGYSHLELVPDGGNVAVTVKNLEQYIKAVTKYLVFDGIIKQVESFREGFSSVFPIESLAIFTPRELKEIFGSGEEDWSRETISESIKANHGYSQDSKAIGMLVNVLQDLKLSERREFLQFLTGSPRLPIGGFKAMRPEFTVVRKHPDAGLSGDDYLPSVMTCANYLKLPDYSLETLLKLKLFHAMQEGAGAFHLS